MVHLLPYKNALSAIGACGFLSAVASAALLLHLTVAVIQHIRRVPLSGARERVARFATTQSGILLCNLLFADFIQGIGFALSLHWSFEGDNFGYLHPPTICKTQAIFIQFADVAQAGFTLAIGVYTAAAIFGRRCGQKVLCSIIAFLWLFTLFLTVLGPHLRGGDNRPFYCGSDEAYCWISPNFKHLRLPLHFIWILLTSLFNIPLYALVFFHVRFRTRPNESSSTDRSSASGKRMAPSRSDQTKDSRLAQRIDNVALRMLCFPAAYLATTLFITVYRLAQLDGQDWSWQTLTTASCFYALTGLVDVLLFTWTRNLVALPTRQPSFVGTTSDRAFLAKLPSAISKETYGTDSKDDFELPDKASFVLHTVPPIYLNDQPTNEDLARAV